MDLLVGGYADHVQTDDDVDARRRTARNAQLYTLTVVTVGIAVLLATIAIGAVAGAECGPEKGYFACHTTARAVVAAVPTAVFLLGAIGAFALTYQVWRHRGEWRIWHAAGWALFVLMLVYIGVAGSSLASS